MSVKTPAVGTDDTLTQEASKQNLGLAFDAAVCGRPRLDRLQKDVEGSLRSPRTALSPKQGTYHGTLTFNKCDTGVIAAFGSNPKMLAATPGMLHNKKCLMASVDEKHQESLFHEWLQSIQFVVFKESLRSTYVRPVAIRHLSRCIDQFKV